MSAEVPNDQPRDMPADVAELESKLAARDARIAELEAGLAARDAQLAELAARVEGLEEKLRRNSSNSHLPPSSDGPGAAGRGERPAGKSPSGRKRGGQKGHRGSYRALLPVECVGALEELYPAACEGCGALLPETPDVDAKRYQVLELLGCKPHVTEFRRHEVACVCGHRTRAAYDATRIPSSPFGPRLVAVVALLTGVYHLSRRATQRLLHELFGIAISLGALSRIEARASAALTSAAGEAQREVEAAEVKHTDATSWLRAGIVMSLWTIASAMATVYRIIENGRRDTVRKLYGTLRGILVSDRAAVFDFWLMAFRQVCWAHLLRKFVSFSERDGPAGIIGRELLDCTSLVFEYWHGFRDGQLTRHELATWMRPLQQRLEVVLERAAAAGIARLSGSCKDILAHREALWTFVTHEGVEPTNNHAERELRAFVLWRRRSFGSQSERGERFAERVMTVVHTARKQGKNVLDFLVDCCTARARGTTPPSLLGLAAPR